MAHFAEVDQNNIVVRVLVTNNDDPNGDEGYSLLLEKFGGRWIKTSYNTFGGIHREGGIPLRKNYAGIGYFYDEEKDAFIPPKPSSYTDSENNLIDFKLNVDTCLWESYKS